MSQYTINTTKLVTDLNAIITQLPNTIAAAEAHNKAVLEAAVKDIRVTAGKIAQSTGGVKTEYPEVELQVVDNAVAVVTKAQSYVDSFILHSGENLEIDQEEAEDLAVFLRVNATLPAPVTKKVKPRVTFAL